jgi:LmbE family N-acetylglucosaminyl deacetylase
LAALHILGVAPEATAFLRLPDTAVPLAGQPGFAEATGRVEALLDRAVPETILLPWRRDPHCDHQAAWQLVHAALAGHPERPRLLEYPIWVWELASEGDLPLPDEVAGWRLDVWPVLALKEAAIAAHRSQTTDLIADDPDGFRLLPEVLAHFTQPWEIFLEERAGSAR